MKKVCFLVAVAFFLIAICSTALADISLSEKAVNNIIVKELSSPATFEITIKNDKGRLSTSEIERMVSEASKYEIEDKARKEQVEEKQKVEGFLYGSRNSVRESKTDNPNAAKIESIVKEGLEWLDKHQDEPASVYTQKQKELEQLIYPLFQVPGGDGKNDADDEMYSNKTNPFTDGRPDVGPKVNVEELD